MLAQTIAKELEDYLDKLEIIDFKISWSKSDIEINLNKSFHHQRGRAYYLLISDDENSIILTTLFLPQSLHGQKIGMNLLKITYWTARYSGCDKMVVYQMTNWFYNYLRGKGARPISEDAVQILDSTKI
ncbi:hypothetical protein [Guptibacillus hwajinpoensis]|uniref:N-acetyltransferase domain-containing protein n=1 Tax=Guptibacillus hwajinpoensis TaxID=208199 RepID=A0ABU0JWR9_9BACL|nr:hypothetical protein [Alkalihalobacillus hemicentroti]MDQ0481536.1 hypothetical protein [Alkalihalobacillus hemicentroti]